MAEQPEVPALDAGKVERLVASMMQALKDGNATVLEAYTASRAVQETFFQTLTKGVKDKSKVRKLLDGIG